MVEYMVFDLREHHRASTKGSWKSYGLVFENDLAFHVIYKRYIFATKCELCKEVFEKSIDRQMEHCHTTNKFRNIVCQSCNHRKKDVKMSSNNTSGYTGIYKHGNGWQFTATIKGKPHYKDMPDKDELIKYADDWKRENNFYT